MGLNSIYGYGYGSGDGDGDGYGSGYGYGYGDGYGDGDGYGYGYGYGYGDGDGSGYGSGEINILKQNAFKAFHYIKRIGNKLKTRNGDFVQTGEVLYEPEIKMCEYGLHASLSKKDARQYKPANSVLTKVIVWGQVIVSQDKLVATHRKIIEVVDI